jgi:hypothetical protein
MLLLSLIYSKNVFNKELVENNIIYSLELLDPQRSTGEHQLGGTSSSFADQIVNPTRRYTSPPACECPHCWGTGLSYRQRIRTDRNPPLVPSVDWWVLTTANVAGTNGLTCFLKHGGHRGYKHLVTYSMTDQHCLISSIDFLPGEWG